MSDSVPPTAAAEAGKVVRGTGTTRSEQYLARIAERSFLNLWSYPNVYNDKKSYAKGDGKELCDLLVVCGDHVLIFSDKSIAWPAVQDINLAWSRWFRHAIQRSVKQIRGAQRWLSNYPDRVFLDPKCSQPLPIKLPPLERRIVHGIVVALGAGEACRKYFQGGIGSLAILPEQKGEAHATSHPFHTGDVDPSGPFIHVFDDATLDIVMGELDTISDLTAYLLKKEKLIRAPQFHGAAGEEDLLAYYMVHMNAEQEHDFTKPDGTAWGPGDNFKIAQGQYAHLRRDRQYVAMKEANEISYIWDELIGTFTRPMLAGTTIVPEGQQFVLAEQEEAVRHMAQVPRHLRRMHSEVIADALKIGADQPRMVRAILPGLKEKDRSIGFFFLTLAVPNFDPPISYDDYRVVRRHLLEIYAWSFMQRNENLQRIVGIAREPLRGKRGGGMSEDLLLAERPQWTPEFVQNLEKAQQELDIFREGNFKEYEIEGNEFPDATTRPGGFRTPLRQRGRLKRRERRALESKKERRRQRKAKKKQ
jgi:hypothetical protein